MMPFWTFADKMRNPAAADIVKAIKNFLAEFGASEPNPDRDSDRVQVRFSDECDFAEKMADVDAVQVVEPRNHPESA